MFRKLGTVSIGALIGFLGAVGIYFDPQEPYPGFITVAGTLSGITLALLIAGLVKSDTSLPRSLVVGALLGLLYSSTVFLAKGGWSTWDAPYVVPTLVITGLILGTVARKLA